MAWNPQEPADVSLLGFPRDISQKAHIFPSSLKWGFRQRLPPPVGGTKGDHCDQ